MLELKKKITNNKRLSAVGVILGLGLVTGISLGVSGVVSALTYTTSANLRFTFNPSISIVLSSPDLSIKNLTPGSTATTDSNIITVRVLSNNATGYSLTANVGNNSTYASAGTNLVNTANSNYTFSSIPYSTTPTTTSLTTDNTWAFSYATYNSSTGSYNSWSNYNGLPLYTSANPALLLQSNTTSAANGDPIKFKIAARAGNNQASGEYKNVVNFNLTANPASTDITMSQAFANAGKMTFNGYYRMQDMNSTICSNTTVTNDQTQLIDTRDDKVYYVSKLDDGNCWMTQNLDVDINDDGGGGGDFARTDTDVPATFHPNINYYTHTANDATWNYYTDKPESYDPGDLCWDGTMTDGTLSNRTTPCTQIGNHYHIGNYYNWTAAVAMTDSSSYATDDVDVNQSICPAGWTLPKGGSDTSSGSFAYLVDEAELTSGTSGNIHASPYYFVYGGSWWGRSDGVGSGGSYWSSTARDDTYAYDLGFAASGGLVPDFKEDRDLGFSVRCLAR